MISCLALFLALTGSAFAVGVAKNSVRSRPDRQRHDSHRRRPRQRGQRPEDRPPTPVGNAEIAENAVDSPEVAQDSLTASDLGAASVSTSEVADQSLTSADLGPNSVGSSELQAGSVRASELGPIIQVTNEVTIKGKANANVNANCPAGTSVISGGFHSGFYQVSAARVLPQQQRLARRRPQRRQQRHRARASMPTALPAAAATSQRPAASHAEKRPRDFRPGLFSRGLDDVRSCPRCALAWRRSCHRYLVSSEVDSISCASSSSSSAKERPKPSTGVSTPSTPSSAASSSSSSRSSSLGGSIATAGSIATVR